MFFNLFKKKKEEELPLTEEDKKWNKMWDLWSDGEIESPYNELMTYQSEVNNGGHDQYFLNTSDNSDIEKELNALYEILPEEAKENLKKAYKAYLKLEENEDDEEAQEILENADNNFWENEEQITEIIKKRAEKIE
ncbi:MAG: DUF4375 domain-containing protein [Clostridia bacterium]|nr:DUF4375 domain-containing protein [Clostridia bacterium]